MFISANFISRTAPQLGLVHRHELGHASRTDAACAASLKTTRTSSGTPEQIKDEIIGVYKLIDSVYSTFGLNYTVELSTRPRKLHRYRRSLGASDRRTERRARRSWRAVQDNEGDGAFCGPKIDFHIEDSLGRTWLGATIQLDMNLPELFDLTYIGPDNQRHRPVMIHRVVFGALERFIGIITEHFAGAFPLWLAPVQVKVLPIVDACNEYCDIVAAELEAAGTPSKKDYRSEKFGFPDS